ncbi:hypothetical protein KY320_04460 [Candidatus Woesearchaeota archaeon]|nr:hypothetical protein [Candidatus Woesearchaeota archaeon]
MESYPRQCAVPGGQTFVEEIENREDTVIDIYTCTEEEKAAQICTMEYMPVCGDNGVTYGNKCSACAGGEIDSYTIGECPEIIGGERDEYGCLGPAGYSYNENVKGCVREWELDDNQEQAAKLAVAAVGYSQGLTIIEVQTMRCPGCFDVVLEKDGERMQVNIDNWEIGESEASGVKLTYAEALAIAEESECAEQGRFVDSFVYNDNSRTWWIDMEMYDEFEKDNCNPACVVSENTGSAEINWRCTGAVI